MLHNKNDQKPRYIWQTWWSIIGPRLTKSEVMLRNNIVLAPINDEEFTCMKTHRAPVASVNPSSDPFVIHYPPRDEVQSRHRLQIDIEARDQDEACELAQQIADRLIVSLSLAVPGGRYYAELRKLRRADEGEENTPWSQTVRFTPLVEPDNLQDGDIGKVLNLFDAAELDPTAQNAYVHLLSAWQLQSTAGSKPLERSILQHYFLCVEAIVNGSMKEIKKHCHDAIRLKERTFANEFAESLPKRADKAKAIRDASTELRKISLSNMIPSIERVAPFLELPDTLKYQAKELYRFRSSSLSHPGRGEAKGFQKWLRSGQNVAEICLADSVARAFFEGYCEHVFRMAKSR